MVDERKQRTDRGKVRWTERDVKCFEWLTDMKAVYEEDLAVWLAREAGKESPLSAATMRGLTKRWVNGEVAEVGKILANRPRIIRLLPRGAELVGEPSFRATSEMMSYHTAEVARFRIWVERGTSEHGELEEWQSERRMRQHYKSRRGGLGNTHVTDADIKWSDGTRAAVEVELSPKDRRRVDQIVEALVESPFYEKVFYVTDNRAVEVMVRSAYDKAKEAREKAGRTTELAKLLVLDLPKDLEV